MLQRTIGFILFSLCFFVQPLNAQQRYFADGYHGGIYGHYPLWQTQFMVDTLLKYPQWKINLEIEPETWDTVQVKDPQGYANFKALFADSAVASRIEFVNPAYGQSYMYMAGGESMIRQLYYGMQKIKAHFPQATFTTYSSEEPCFTSALPQVLRSFGFKYAVLKNPNTCWGGYVKNYGGEIMNWVGPDGTTIQLVPRYTTEALEENSTWQTTAWFNSNAYISSALAAGIKNPVGMCLQDAGWRNGLWLPKNDPSVYTTWRNYFKHIADTTNAESWRVSQQDIKVSLVWGAQVLQKIAQQVRSTENKLLQAEKLAGMYAIANSKPLQEGAFDDAWRTLLLSQHHDCWIVPYNGHKGDTWADKVVGWTNNSNRIADSILSKQLQSDSGNGQSVTVYNSSLNKMNEMVTVPLPQSLAAATALSVKDGSNTIAAQVMQKDGQPMAAFPASLQPMSNKVYNFVAAKTTVAKPAAITSTGDQVVMQTDLYTLTIDKKRGGAMTSLIAKKINNYEFVDKNATTSFNALQGNFYEEGGKAFSGNHQATVEVLDNGPLLIRVAIHNTIASHSYTQYITMRQGEQRIDVSLKINWKGNPRIGEDYAQHGGYDGKDLHKAFYNDTDKLILTFPLQLKEQKVYADAPFDVTESRLNNTFYNRWDSIKNNVILNWVDVTDAQNKCGLALLTDHTTSYSHGKDFPLSLTVQYAGVGLWGRDYTANGTTEINYALIPHMGDWKQAILYTAATNWNEPLYTATGAAKPMQSLLSCGDAKWLLSSLTQQGDQYLIRLFNAEGDHNTHTLTFGFPVKAVTLVDLAGNITQQPVSNNGNQLQLAIPEKGFVTLAVSTK